MVDEIIVDFSNEETELEELKSLVDEFKPQTWTWDDTKVSEDGQYRYTPQGSSLGGTNISLQYDDEQSGDYCRMIELLCKYADKITNKTS